MFWELSCSLNDMHVKLVDQIDVLLDVSLAWQFWDSLRYHWVYSIACWWCDFDSWGSILFWSCAENFKWEEFDQTFLNELNSDLSVHVKTEPFCSVWDFYSDLLKQR